MIRSKWTLDQYRELVLSLVDRGLTPLDIARFERRTPGFWLRHDVELSLDAAVAMAEVEAEIGVPSSYFVCVESPYVTSDDTKIVVATDHLSQLGRDVSFHLVLSPTIPAIDERLRTLALRFPSLRPRSLTFHAPGVPVADLASETMGATVYQPLVDEVGHYFSDSTGRWRWGHPEHADLTSTDLIQILTHPFWWSGRYLPAELASSDEMTFLPQLATSISVAPKRREP